MNGITLASLINIASGFVTVLTLLALLWTALRYSYNPTALNLQAEIGKGTAMGLLEMAKQAKRDGRAEDECLLVIKAASLLEACGAWDERKEALQTLGARYMERAEEARTAGDLDEAKGLFKLAEFNFELANDKDGQVAAVQARIPVEIELGRRQAIEESPVTPVQLAMMRLAFGEEFDLEKYIREQLKQLEKTSVDDETSRIRRQRRTPRWFYPSMFAMFILYLAETVWYYFILTPSHR